MYIWNINKLKEDISSGNLEESERFKYLLVYVFLTAVSIEISFYLPIENPNKWDWISSVIPIFIGTIGTILAYKSNDGSKGTDFLGKYFSIGFVLIIDSLYC
ncbi:MAG: hypothetical protein GWM89_12595 [Candidatus Dadabacteria bacterium]|nr:hypothetical protein [Candidatus Dadabacteria bacterium]NIX16661.1 hypothetical protein [Candidatus Dadabacteria bacterium]NIY23227.1 hypothetical protein [Candidatus Dadabacteria bacterium]